jgi:CheY-specific phosphatase CheX
MNPADTQVPLREYLLQSTIELFTDIGAVFAPVEKSDWMPDITAVLGFAGGGIAGSIAVCTCNDCLKGLASLGQTEMGEDWLGELSNQLAGRFKRRLAPHGATYSLGTPVVIMGERLRLTVGAARDRAQVLSLESKLGRVEVWLELEFRDGFELSAQPKEDGTLIEGEALLF